MRYLTDSPIGVCVCARVWRGAGEVLLRLSMADLLDIGVKQVSRNC